MTNQDESKFTISKKTNLSIGLGVVILSGVVALFFGALGFKGEVSAMAVNVTETREDVRDLRTITTAIKENIRSIDRRVMQIEAERRASRK